MYGYKIIKEIEGNSNGVFIFKEGTLYPILHDLEKKKFIESYWEVENGRRRKYYKITKKGVKELEVREQEWQLFSKTMGVVLRGQILWTYKKILQIYFYNQYVDLFGMMKKQGIFKMN